MVYDNYIELKDKYKNYIVMIKVGNFYHTYDDSVILHYLFQYKIKNNMLGFPIGALKKVVAKLDREKISYYIHDYKCNDFENNTYLDILKKAELYLKLRGDVEDIYQYLMSNIERKYIKKVIDKIKVIIDEG